MAVETEPHLSTNVVTHLPFIGLIRATIHIQEFHDAAGNRVMGRRSLPLILGENQIVLVRKLTFGTFCIIHAGFLIWGVKLKTGSTLRRAVLLFGSAHMALGVAVGLRVMLSSSVQMDKKHTTTGMAY
jgi:hypothetical protein